MISTCMTLAHIAYLIPVERYSVEMLHLFQTPWHNDIWGHTAGWTHEPNVISLGDESRDARQLWRGELSN